MGYLIGREHGWLGALGFGPAAFVLAPRDQWIGWSTRARLGQLHQVVGLARQLLRPEVRCTNLVSKVLSMVLARLLEDWLARYGTRPVLVETFADRQRFTGRSLRAANWRWVGQSNGRGRLGPATPATSPKDIWLYPLAPRARQQLQVELPLPLAPLPLLASLAQAEWVAHELAGLALGNSRWARRAHHIVAARWAQPQKSFHGSFANWGAAKGAYGLIAHASPDLSLASLLAPHQEATQARMAAEALVLLPQDTTTLNYTGLRKTTGLGPLGEAKSQVLWLHTLLACRADGLPLGVLNAHCRARPPAPTPQRGRNAKALVEKESRRWLDAFHTPAAAARACPKPNWSC